MRLKRGILFFSTALLVLTFCSTPLLSQKITGSLEGTVVLKEDNSSLSNVNVTIESPNLMGKQIATSNKNGNYRFPSLPPGVYKVTVEFQGLGTIIREGIVIRVGGTTTLIFAMEAAEIKESILIVGKSPVVDIKKSGLSTNITSEALQAIPMARNYLQIIQLAPGVNTTSSNPSVHGESSQNNQYLIDGVDTTDPVDGTSGTSYNFDNIDEIEFETAGYKAEYGQVMGAVINIVTKSGGNKFSGALNINLMDPSFTGNNVPEDEKEAYPVKNSLRDYSFTLGGPILKDKVWFFGSFQLLNSIQKRDDVDYDNSNKSYRWLGKVTTQFNPDHKAVFMAWGDPYEGFGGNLDPYWAYETCPRSFGGSAINAAGIWYWTLNNNAFLQTKISRFATASNLEPTQNDSIPQTYDIFTQERTGNYTFHYLSDRIRFQAESDLTYFLDDLAGSHEIKAGIEYSYAYERKQLWSVGDGWGLFICGMGMPMMAMYKPGKEDVQAKSNRVSLYVQDTWNITKRLTLNPGIRFDYSVGKNDILETINNYKTFSPRFGFVYSITADGKTIFKGNYGVFYENPILFFPNIFHKGQTPTTLFMYNPWTQTYNIPLQSSGGPSAYTFLNEIKSPNVREYLLGIEREVLPNLSVSLVGITRKTKDIIEDVETNMLYENPATPYTPTGSKDGTGQAKMAVGNPDEAYREYKGLELSLNKKFANKWMLLASYTLSETKGTVSSSFTGYLDSPGDTINRDGYLSVDRTHNVKVAASYILPFGFNVGFRYQLLSGLPYTKSLMNPFYGYYGVYETPLGEEDPVTGKKRRYPTLHSVDLRIEKTFNILKGQFAVYADIFNLFNTNTATSYYTFDNPQYEQISKRTSPIALRLNLRYSF
jgi:hypothetical protein